MCRRIPSVAALALASALLCGPVAAPAAAAIGSCALGAGWAAPRPADGTAVVGLINHHRARRGTPALAVSPTLTASAAWKASHMATSGLFGHDDLIPPVTRTPAERAVDCGYPAGPTTGENLAGGSRSPEEVMQKWLASAGHRRAIEEPAFRAIGVSAATARDGMGFWAAEFGAAADPGSSFIGAPTPTPVDGGAGAVGGPGTAPGGAPRTTSPDRAGHAGSPRLLVRSCRRTKRSGRAASCRIRVLSGPSPASLRGRMIRNRRTVARARVATRGARSFPLRFKAPRRLNRGRTVLELGVNGSTVQLSVRLR